MAAPRLQPRSTTLMLPTKAFVIWDLISKKLLPNEEREAGTPLPLAVTTITNLDPWSKKAKGKLIKIAEDWAVGGTLN